MIYQNRKYFNDLIKNQNNNEFNVLIRIYYVFNKIIIKNVLIIIINYYKNKYKNMMILQILFNFK